MASERERKRLWKAMHNAISGDECDILREALDARIKHYERQFKAGAKEYPDEGKKRDFRIVALLSLRKLVAHSYEQVKR